MPCCRWTPEMHAGGGLFQMTICLVFTIVGYVGNYWADYASSNFGLWEFCTSGNCISLPDSLETSKIKAARAFGILGMLTSVGAMVMAILYLVKKKAEFLVPAAILAALAFVTVMIMFITAVEQVKDSTSSDFGYCFGLVLSGFIQAFFGALSFLSARHRHRQCQQTV